MALTAALKQVPTDLIDIYDVDADICTDPGFKARVISNTFGYEQQNYVDPCLELYMPPYLNRADVQKALHVEPTKWQEYGTIHYGTMNDNMIPVWQEILNNPRSKSWRILIFSGDFDSVVPFLSTQRWIHCLGLSVKKSWYPWMIGDQLGGNIIEYDRMSFLTVKGSGHDVSYYTPAKGYEFFKQWMENELP